MSDRIDGIGKELEALRDKKSGKIVPSECVKWARRNTKSHLHAHLEWDDEVAGERYRQDQVRNLLQVHIVDPQGHRRYVSLSIDRGNGGGYRELSDVMSRQDLRAIMLQDALADLERVQRLYGQLRELEPVWQAASKLRPAKAA